jgi:hypothetical protein
MVPEIMPGQAVRYSRTGTVGTITRIEEFGGVRFGCIDTTDLLYRIDLLIPVTLKDGKVVRVERDDRTSITEERLREKVAAESAWLSVDSACEGGG